MEKCNSEFKNYHPLVNIIYFTLVIGVTMFSNNPVFILATFTVSFMYSIYLKGKSAIKFNILCMIPIIIFMAIINALFVHNGETVLFIIRSNRVTLEAIIFGIAAAILLSSIIIWFSCFGEIVTSDKLIYVFGKIAPVLGLTMSMVFRFIPLLKKRFTEIRMGQKCMSMDVQGSKIVSKMRQFAKEISILISWSLEASIETADSMESRGFGLKGRTSFNLYKIRKNDVFAFVYMGIFGVFSLVACIMGETSMYYYPKFEVTSFGVIRIIGLISFIMLLMMPLMIDLKEETKWKRLNLKI